MQSLIHAHLARVYEMFFINYNSDHMFITVFLMEMMNNIVVEKYDIALIHDFTSRLGVINGSRPYLYIGSMIVADIHMAAASIEYLAQGDPYYVAMAHAVHSIAKWLMMYYNKEESLATY